MMALSALSKLKNWLRPAVASAPTVEPQAEDRSKAVGLWDASLRGWYKSETGELYEGFPVSRDDIVVDIGCGDASGTAFCARQGASLIVADIDAEKIAMARQRLAGSPAKSVEFHVTDGNPLPIADGIATRVVCTEVLEHVDDVSHFMRELVRVGQHGALYFITVPDQVAEELQKPIAPDVYFQKPNHVRIIGRDEFARIVTEAGLIVEKRSSYGFYWTVWWMMFWSCKVDFSDPRHPALEHWANAWASLLQTEDGLKVKNLLDDFLPRSQVIIARKP